MQPQTPSAVVLGSSWWVAWGLESSCVLARTNFFSFTVFLFFHFSLQACLHPILSIMETLVTEPYSVTSHLFHKLSGRQPKMLLENRLLLVCNIHEENQHGRQRASEFNYSAKPVLWGEEPSFVHVSELVVWAYRHLPETCDGLFTGRLGFHITHTRTVVFFVLANWKTPLCGSVRDDSLPHKERRPHRRAEDGCKDTHMLTHIIMNTNAHADITSKCRGITSALPRLSLTVFFTQSTLFHSMSHLHRQMFHQRCIFSKLHTLETSVVRVCGVGIGGVAEGKTCFSVTVSTVRAFRHIFSASFPLQTTPVS